MPETDRMPHALYRAEQVRAMDRCAIEWHGIDGRDLMERAGAAAFRRILDRWPSLRRMVVVAGAGNNGGDGYVIARLALERGMRVRLLQLGDHSRLRREAAAAAHAYADAGGPCEPFARLPEDADLIVDALLGTGLERPLAGAWAEAVSQINGVRCPVLAVDVPTGLHADTGRVLGAAVRADLTVTFIGLKQGMFTAAGPELCGEIRFDALQVPAVVYAGQVLASRRLDWQKERELLPRLRRGAHKGDLGHVLVVGGAPGLSGAPRLTAEAALRCGAGLVTLATHPEHAPLANLTRPELMVRAAAGPGDIDGAAERADVVAIGPGLGLGDWSRALLDRVLTLGRPLVVDADALNLLATAPRRTRVDWVLTPHPGEAARLLGLPIAEIERDRFAAVERLQRRFGGVAVLKGAGTLIRGAGHRPTGVCSDGNPGMATAGMGDALTGVIAALIGQGMDPEEAASAGVCVHAAAADRAAQGGQRGLITGDVVGALPGTLADAERGR